MTEWDVPEVAPRTVPARIGLCLLNVLYPGLGLVRLTRYRAAAVIIGINLAAMASMLVVMASPAPLTYTGWCGLLVLILACLPACYGSSIFLTWRYSAYNLPRAGWLWRWYGVLGLAVVLLGWTAPIPNSSVTRYRSFYAPSQSMAPTIEQGDRFVADMAHDQPVSRGDIVIVRKGAVSYVKRVAAIPGDTIVLRDGAVWLNGQRIALRELGQDRRHTEPGEDPARQQSEQFPGEAKPHVIIDAGARPQDTTPPVTLGAGRYFLLGDNRDNSLDSRFPAIGGGLGVVGRDQIVGKVLFGFWRTGRGFGEVSII